MLLPTFEGSLVAPSITFGNNPRNIRLAFEHKSLVKSLLNYVSSRHDMVPLGSDPLVRQVLLAAGLGKFDFFALLVGMKSLIITVIVIPTRVWRNAECRHVILEAKAQAKQLRSRCIVVPQRCLKGNIRSQVARTLALSRGLPIEGEAAETVCAFVRKQRVCSLQECAQAIPDHPDPYGVALALCTAGRILIDRRAPISASSIIAARD